jgi:hypothetical protein
VLLERGQQLQLLFDTEDDKSIYTTRGVADICKKLKATESVHTPVSAANQYLSLLVIILIQQQQSPLHSTLQYPYHRGRQ